MDERESRSQSRYHEAAELPGFVRTPVMDPARPRARTLDDPTGSLGASADPTAGWMAPGMTLGKYELIRPLGRGGMGAVFLARHVQLAQRVAIKSLLVRIARRPGDSERLLAEARTTARCRHENIVVIHDVGVHEGKPYMVLEYLEGQTLRRVLETSGGVLSPGRAIELIVPVLRALTAAHEQGIVHRDLKPENVMLTSSGVVKVLDFGVAQLLATPDDAADPAPEPAPEELASRFMGTPAYMAPEQLERRGIDHRSDLWAIGIILFELVTGRHPLAPFRASRIGQVLDRELPMPRAAELMPDLGTLGSIIDRCLLKHRDLRPDSARALLAELEPLLPGSRIARLGEDESPFPGLAAFQEADAGRFFGRTREIAQMVDHVRRRPLLVIAGPSGAGKSSLVRAGVIPSLKRSGEGWDALVIRPGQRPVAALVDLFWQLAGLPGTTSGNSGSAPGEASGGRPVELGAEDPSGARLRAADAIAARLRKEPGYLGAELRALAGRRLRRIVVFVDQLEELYTLGADAADRAAFVACLESAADDPSSPVRVILTIRSDLLDRVLEDRTFATQLFRNIEPLAPIGRDGLREALIAPLAAAGYRFETEALLERMLDELAGTPGALPLLQFTASRLWDRRDRARRLLTEDSHARVGGVAGALAEHADAVLAGLAEPDAAVARAIFERLVTPQRTRAVTTVGEIRELAGDPAQIDRMLACLTEARLLAVESASSNGERAQATVELVHESLIESWPTLRRWLYQDEDDRAFLARLRVAARQWEASGHSDDLLWRGQAAHDARRWLHRRGLARAARPIDRELGEREQRMLSAIVKRANRARRRIRFAVAGVFALLVGFAAVVSGLAVRARDEASRADAAMEEASAAAARARNASRMAVARQLRGDPTTMLAVLREIEPPGPPPGWSALIGSALDAGVAETVLVHPELAAAVAYSPDGRRIATACADGAVRVWRSDGAGEPLVLRGHDGFVVAVAFSPDGTRIVSGSKDLTVRVWRADGTGSPVVLRGHRDKIYAVDFSPDGRRVVSGSWDREARVWNADGSGEPLVLRGHDGWIYAARFSPDGARIVTASLDRTARVWNADGTGEPLVLRGHEEAVFAAVFSPDGAHIVTTSLDRTARVWSGDGFRAHHVLREHTRSVMSAAFSPDGARIVTADPGDVRVWSSDDLRQLAVLRHQRAGSESGVVAVAFSPDGHHLATAATDHLARVWNLDALERAPALYGHKDTVHAAAFSPDGARIVTASEDATARIWRLDRATPPVVLPHPREVFHAAFSPDGAHIVTASRDGVRIWRSDGAAPPRKLAGHASWATSAMFSPDGARVVTGSQEAIARVLDADGAGAPRVLRGHSDRTGWAAFDPAGAHVVTASADSTARVWRADGAAAPVILRGHQDALRAAMFSPDGARVITASRDRTARIWRADGAGAPVVLGGHPDQVRFAAFSPDGARVATAALDELRIWRADGAGAPIVVLGDAVLGRFAFSPDGARIVAGMADGTVRIWSDLAPIAEDDPRLWAATSYCLSVAKRQDLLGVTETQARADLAACERRVRAHR
jgi:WD40 repeat protein